MFGMRGYAGAGAGSRYRALDVSSRVEGASPHRLIAILFDELMLALDATAAAQRQGDVAKRGPRQARALAILHALETSLDHEKGGEIAANLAAIYRHARHETLAGVQENAPERIEQARAAIGEIAGAWAGIGNPAAQAA